ncbi:hypothetical protein [Endothiovibrio diazotrophicus]
MKPIDNDQAFHAVLDGMEAARQRQVAARFVEHVLDLADDERVRVAVAAAKNPATTPEMLEAAFKGTKQSVLEHHARCGADCHWSVQAGYFVARAAIACVEPKAPTRGKGLAWQAAMNGRMARTCQLIEAGEESPDGEREAQYRILADFLDC